MFGWLTKPGDIGLLISKQSYPRAIKLARKALQTNPQNVHLTQQLAYLYERSGETGEAAKLLSPLVDRFAEAGFPAKAIAVLKRIERIDPGRPDVERRLAHLIRERDQELRANASSRPGSSARDDASQTEQELIVVRLPEEAYWDNERLQEAMAVQRSTLFGDFSQEELQAIIRSLDLQIFSPGEILVTEGEPGDSLFVLASGSVRVYARDPSGASQEVRILNQGEFFGEISLLTGGARTATVTAATPCEVLCLDSQALDAIAKDHPQVPEIIRRVYDERANSKEEIEARGVVTIPL